MPDGIFGSIVIIVLADNALHGLGWCHARRPVRELGMERRAKFAAGADLSGFPGFPGRSKDRAYRDCTNAKTRAMKFKTLLLMIAASSTALAAVPAAAQEIRLGTVDRLVSWLHPQT